MYNVCEIKKSFEQSQEWCHTNIWVQKFPQSWWRMDGGRPYLRTYVRTLVLGTWSKLLCRERRARPDRYHCSRLRTYCGARPLRTLDQDYVVLPGRHRQPVQLNTHSCDVRKLGRESQDSGSSVQCRVVVNAPNVSQTIGLEGFALPVDASPSPAWDVLDVLCN